MDQVIGELIRKPSDDGWEWQIQDFPSLPQEVDKFYYSGAFFFSGAFWKLLLNPNGQSQHQSVGHISLYLWRLDSGPPFKLRYSLGARMADGMERIIAKDVDLTLPFEKVKSFGRAKFLMRLELDEFLSPSRVLTVTCNMVECVHIVDGK